MALQEWLTAVIMWLDVSKLGLWKLQTKFYANVLTTFKIILENSVSRKKAAGSNSDIQEKCLGLCKLM